MTAAPAAEPCFLCGHPGRLSRMRRVGSSLACANQTECDQRRAKKVAARGAAAT